MTEKMSDEALRLACIEQSVLSRVATSSDGTRRIIERATAFELFVRNGAPKPVIVHPCSKCGAEIRQGYDLFCTQCGTKVK